MNSNKCGDYCWFCGETIGKFVWGIRRQRCKNADANRYCSAKCAKDDIWGPIFKNAKAVRVRRK